MKTEELSLLLNVVQTVIFVLSFAGLIWQLRQFNQNLRHEAYSRDVDYYIKLNELLLDKPHITKFLYPDSADFSKMDGAEKDFYTYLALILGFYEHLYLLFKMKIIDRKTWEVWERWLIQALFPVSLFDTFWENERFFFHVDFYTYVDKEYKKFKEQGNLSEEKVIC